MSTAAPPAATGPADRDYLHLPGLPDDIPVVRTAAFRKTQALAADTTRLRDVAAFTGAPGLGKSFAVDFFCKNQDLEWVWLEETTTRPSSKALLVELMRALTGNCDTRMPAYDLADELRALLADTPRVVVVDEAQRFGPDGISQLRFLHDRGDADWALLFVGGDGCWEVLSSQSELRDRIYAHVTFRPLDLDRLLPTLTAYHPLFTGADPELLARIDRRYARGVFRRWVRVLQHAMPLAERAGADQVTVKIARVVLNRIGEDSEDS